MEKDDNEVLLNAFNQGSIEAYNMIYLKIYDELYHYACKLFADTSVSGNDVLQEIFLSLWEKRKNTFQSIAHLKNYLYIAIRNKYKDYQTHLQYVHKYEENVSQDEDMMFTYMVEAETRFLLKTVSSLLPEECAKTFLLYMQGWEIKEIASKFNKAPSTVYAQRNRAIEILKEKLSKDLLLLIMHFRKSACMQKLYSRNVKYAGE